MRSIRFKKGIDAPTGSTIIFSTVSETEPSESTTVTETEEETEEEEDFDLEDEFDEDAFNELVSSYEDDSYLEESNGYANLWNGVSKYMPLDNISWFLSIIATYLKSAYT